MLICCNFSTTAIADVPDLPNDGMLLLGTSYVFTPNGTSVSVTMYAGMTPDEVREHIEIIEELYPDVYLISDPTYSYNCHSYAWYSQDAENNHYCMADPSAYYTDGSYHEVQTPKVGDIICYFDNSGINLHSGIIIEVLDDNATNPADASLYMVRSKWGLYGLYEHRGDRCLYVENSTTIKFYRRTCNHDYEYTWLSKLLHNATCTECGDLKTELHVIARSALKTNAIGVAYCVLCGGITGSGQIIHPDSTNLPSTPNGSYILPNGIIVLDDRDFEAYFNGRLVFSDNDLLTMVA